MLQQLEDDEAEARRVEYLRRHREALLQRQRFETERRVQEWAADRQKISDRDAAVRQDKAAGARDGKQPSLPGTYSDFDQLDAETLQRVAETQSQRELAPLNMAGKYHARYMKDRYPIAGTQLKLEKERETFLAAKKKLLLDSKTRERTQQQGVRRTPDSAEAMTSMRQRASFSKLDYHIESMTRVLEREQQLVDRDEAERQVRLLEVRDQKALEQFWRLISSDCHRETVAWLRSHTFVDVNIPVRVSSTPFAAQLDRDFGVTPLMVACSLLNVKMIVYLLEHGAFVPLTTGNGDSALHFLWKSWPDDQSGSVLGADASMKDVAELMLKAQRVSEILEMLVERGAPVNAQNAFGETPLQFCARFGLEECAKLLLRHGADPFVADRMDKSAAQYAQEHRHDNLHRILLNYSTIQRVRAREGERAAIGALLRKKPGLLSASWSQPPETLLVSLAVQDQRVGRLRNQYVDRCGNVIVSPDDD